MTAERALLEVNALKKHFPIHGGLLGQVTGNVYAVDGVTFDIRRGETLSLVGESGCGKSTVGKAILRLFTLTDGEVYLDGERIDNMPAGKLRLMRQRVQVVFQDPFSSLNPRMKVRDILAEPLINFGMAQGPPRPDREGRGADGQGPPAARCDQPLPARILRRPAPAHRHRSRPGARRRPDHLR